MMGLLPKPAAIVELCHSVLPESRRILRCRVRSFNTQSIAVALALAFPSLVLMTNGRLEQHR